MLPGSLVYFAFVGGRDYWLVDRTRFGGIRRGAKWPIRLERSVLVIRAHPAPQVRQPITKLRHIKYGIALPRRLSPAESELFWT